MVSVHVPRYFEICRMIFRNIEHNIENNRIDLVWSCQCGLLNLQHTSSRLIAFFFVFGALFSLAIYELKSHGPRRAKMCLRAYAKCSDSDSSHACAKSHLGI